MKLTEILDEAGRLFPARLVYAEAVSHGSSTVVPGALVIAAGGGGSGREAAGEEGGGGGFGVAAWPVGAYVMTERGVRWRPALGVEATVGAIALVAVTGACRRRRACRMRVQADATRGEARREE